jgi:hypothetical protein
VDVLGTLLELGERRDGVASFSVLRIIDLEEDRAVTLNDERTGWVVGHGLLASE